MIRLPLSVFPRSFRSLISWSILEFKIQYMYITMNLFLQIFILLTYVHNIYTMLQAFFSFFFSIWEIRHALAFFLGLPFQHSTLRPFFFFIKTITTKTCMKTKRYLYIINPNLNRCTFMHFYGAGGNSGDGYLRRIRRKCK